MDNVAFNNVVLPGAVVWILGVFIQYKLMLLMKKPKRAGIYMIVTIFACWFFGSTWLAYGLYLAKYTKIRKKKFEKIAFSVNNDSPDELKKYIKAWDLQNDPKSWNELRGVWTIINESPNVSADKKRDLRDFLIIKGLRLTGIDKNVIDNYGKRN